MSNALSLPNVVNFPPSLHAMKRPRPYVKMVDQSELDWDPQAIEQYVVVDGEKVRSGDSYAIVRPGMERWPLGHVSDVYKVTGHRETVAMIHEACNETVSPYMRPLMAAHGTRVVHQFSIVDEAVEQVHGMPVTSRLTVVHDHTGLHALRARMVLYVGDNTVGSMIGSRAIHTASNPERWKLEVERMVQQSALAREAVLAMLRAADTYIPNQTELAMLQTYKVTTSTQLVVGTLLDAVVQHYRGSNSDITWGVWERRLSDAGLRAMAKILDRKYAVDIDTAMGIRYYSK